MPKPPAPPDANDLASNALAIARYALAPSVPGHTVIAVRRPVPSYFAATSAERAAVWELLDEVKQLLDAALQPSGYEVRFATGSVSSEVMSGAAASQESAHIHVLPLFRSSAPPSPLLSLLPGSGLDRAPPLATGGERDPLGPQLWPLFAEATDIAIVAAFVTETGLELLEPRIFAALQAGARVRIVTGDYLGFNQVDALRQLLGWSQLELGEAEDEPQAPGPQGALHVRVVESQLPDGSERAFHPKAWLFESSGAGAAFVGSSNLSLSALLTGIEWNLRVERGIDPLAYACVRGAVDAGPRRRGRHPRSVRRLRCVPRRPGARHRWRPPRALCVPRRTRRHRLRDGAGSLHHRLPVGIGHGAKSAPPVAEGASLVDWITRSSPSCRRSCRASSRPRGAAETAQGARLALGVRGLRASLQEHSTPERREIKECRGSTISEDAAVAPSRRAGCTVL